MLKRFRSYADLADDLRRLAHQGTVRTISFDVFDTMVHRRLAPDLVLDGVCHVLRDLLAEQGLAPPARPLMELRHEAYVDLVTPHVGAGLDPDTTLDELAPAWLARAAGHTLAPEVLQGLGARLAAAEASLERRVCYPNPWLKALLPELKRAGIQILCISDMYLGERYVRAILADGGLLPWIDAVHVSGDLRLLKRTGRLFEHLGKTAGLSAAAWLHVGDNLHADGLMANRNGTRAWIINDRLLHTETRKQAFDVEVYRGNPTWGGLIAAGYAQPLGEEPLSAEETYGRKVLGPIFTSFIHRLLERCRDEGIDRVFFLAREGHLLKKLYGRLAPLVFADGTAPPAVYLAVSRLTALLAAMHGYGIREFNAALANTGHYSLRNLLAPLRLAPQFLAAIAARNGLDDIDAPLPAPILEYPPLQRLLDDPDLRQHISALGTSARELLHAYLAQSGFFDHQRVAVVDLGWGGQIQDSLFSSIRSLPRKPTLFGFYLGTNRQAAWRHCSGSRFEGLLADWRAPHWSSSAALEFVFVLEAASRAPHGTTLGYARGAEGGITPLFREAADPSRRSEMADDGFLALLQSGIVAYANHYADCATILRLSAGDTLPYARLMVERLVRYPSRQEIGWWMRLNNVADLGSASTERLGGENAFPGRLHSLFRARALLRRTPFHYGVVGLAAGTPAQAVLTAIKALRTWRDYRPPSTPALPSLPKMPNNPPPRATVQAWESAVDDEFARVLASAPRTALADPRQRLTALTIAELLPMLAGYRLARSLACLVGASLPGRDVPRLGTMLQRHMHGRYNLRARLALLRQLIAKPARGRR